MRTGDSHGDLPPTLHEIEELRQLELFVGREPEIERFRCALDGAGPRVLYVWGPAGIGKTSLLRAFAAEARQRSVPVGRVDARDLDLTVPDVMAALDEAGLSAAGEGMRVVLFDTYEHLTLIEPQIFRELFRRIGAATRLVVAGRLRPSMEWRSISVWGGMVVPIALRNLAPSEVDMYLDRRGMPKETARSVLAFSHGHPLTLALAADAWQNAPDAPFSPADKPDLLTAVYGYFTRGIVEPERHVALEVLAILPEATEAMLGLLLERDATSTFAWLRELSFVELGRRGILPHDAARDAILEDLRWRNPQRLTELALRALRYYTRLLRKCAEHKQAVIDYAYVLGHHPRLRVLRTYQHDGFTLDGLQASDEPVLCAAVQRHEGPTSMEYLRWWLHHQPSSFEVVRDLQGVPVAFSVNLRLDLTTEQQRKGDPLVCAVWDYAARLLGEALHAPMVYMRFWMGRETYTDPSPAMGILHASSGCHFVLPKLTLRFVRVCESERRKWAWDDLATFVGARFEPELTHEIDGRTYEVTVEDHRGISGAEWFVAMNNRLAAGDWGPPTSPTPRPDRSSVIAFSRDEFGKQLRHALRLLHDLVALEKNPLTHSHAVSSKLFASGKADASDRERAAALRALLFEEAEKLRGATSEDRLYRVLSAAYLNNRKGEKHMVVANKLGLSYPTFRRSLAEATQRLMDALWEQDLC